MLWSWRAFQLSDNDSSAVVKAPSLWAWVFSYGLFCLTWWWLIFQPDNYHWSAVVRHMCAVLMLWDCPLYIRHIQETRLVWHWRQWLWQVYLNSRADVGELGSQHVASRSASALLFACFSNDRNRLQETVLEEACRLPQNRDALLEAKPIQSQAALQEAFASNLQRDAHIQIS